MPTLSASDYTRYLKFKAANITPIRPSIQTRDNVTTSQSLMNAETLASQAAFDVAPAATVVLTSTATVTSALTSVINGSLTSYAGSSGIRYTTVQPHGLTNGQSVTVAGLAQGTLNVDPNVTGNAIVDSTTTFVLVVSGVTTGTASGTGRLVGRVYYTTNVYPGVSVGDVVSVTGITTFSASNATVLATPSATTFVLSSTTTGVQVTGQTGVLTTTRASNSGISITGLARVQAPQVVQQRATAVAKSTLSFPGTSGAVSSSRFQRPGGLPTGFKNSQSTYTRLPQQAGW